MLTVGVVTPHRAAGPEVELPETALVERMRGICGVPVVDETDALGVGYFRDQRFDAVLAKANDLPMDPREVRAEDVVERVGGDLGDEVDAMFIAGNAFRAAAAIEELERRTGLLVLEANQVLLWSILAATRARWAVAGYGRLFRGAG